MTAYRPLQRELPHLHRSGAIKFLAVLGMARGQRAVRRRLDADERRPRAACLIRRFDRVRQDMGVVRDRIAEMRAMWSVDNRPTIVMERVRREAHGHVWYEAVEVRPAALAEAA